MIMEKSNGSRGYGEEGMKKWNTEDFSGFKIILNAI